MTRATTTTLRSGEEPSGEQERRSLGLRFLFPNARRLPVRFAGAAVRLGRKDSDVVLSAAGVSRLHAEIYRQGAIWVIRDCGSTNGTFVHGERVGHQPLETGQLLRIGGHLMQVAEVLGTELAGATGEPSFGALGESLLGGATLRRRLAPVFEAATSKLPVVLSGETGTGKERVARAIHARSGRTGRFVVIDCAALPEPLAASELFGHRKGAFTGAAEAAPGRLRLAHRGTVLLDEITELGLPLQAQLLRVLQEGEVTPLGEGLPTAVDVRFVATCHRPLRSYVERGVFREDLYMRLAGVECLLPALRERIEDIPQLFATFLGGPQSQSATRVHVRAMEALCLQPWPGNVRQLEMLARRLSVLGRSESLRVSDLPLELQPERRASSRPSTGASERRAHDRRRLLRALESNGGNLTRAAAELGLSRQRAYRVLGQERAAAARDGEPGGSKPAKRSTSYS